MEYISAILGLCFFIVPFLAYRKGLKDGLNITQGKPIEPIKPIQMIKEQFTKHEPNEIVSQGISNIMSYDGTPQKEKE
jgi:hypothetical protein